MNHLLMAPILAPLLAGVLMLLATDRRRSLNAAIALVSCAVNLGLALRLTRWVARGEGVQALGVYLPSNWPVPFGIVLVLDRLSAMMVLLTAVVAVAAVFYSLARWQRAGNAFQPLVQFQLMGLNGAFLTGDLFNLFVFFEILLAASYGLMLHGSGRDRILRGMHYIAFNLAASLLFLIGVAVLYGVTGTLNMADMAVKLAAVPAGDRGLLHAGAAILALAFLAKAAMWPLNFWLVPAYAAASAPAAAIFSLLTKVGLYAVVRLWTLLFAGGAQGVADQAAGASQGIAAAVVAGTPFGAPALLAGGLATIAFGALGIFASQRLTRLAAWAIIISSGTVMAALSFARIGTTAGALYYLVQSAIATAALFLLLELIERFSRSIDDLPQDLGEGDALPMGLLPPSIDTNLDENEQALIGRVFPAGVSFLALAFILCTLLLAGLPPMSGFLAKFTMLGDLVGAGSQALGMLGEPGLASAPQRVPTTGGWWLLGVLMVSGLATTIAMTRVGIRLFWGSTQESAPPLLAVECLPILLLLSVSVWLTAQAETVLDYTRGAAQGLHDPAHYIQAVTGAQVRPSPTSVVQPLLAPTAAPAPAGTVSP